MQKPKSKMIERVHFEWNTWAPDLEAHIHFSEYSDQHRLIRMAHTHDFYEIFISLRGNCGHKVGGVQEELKPGCVLFIRPKDKHCFCDPADKQFDGRFINMEISRTLFDLLLEYVGNEEFKQSVMQNDRPPCFQLTDGQRDWLERLLQGNMIGYRIARGAEGNIRAILPLICVMCIENDKELAKQGLPKWMEHLCEEMKKPENFSKDMQYFIDFTGKSHGHICGCFKKYLKTNPVKYFNTVRIEYCAYLLRHTTRDILDIAMCGGFDSISYFFSQFKKRFQTTPNKYRQQWDVNPFVHSENRAEEKENPKSSEK